MGDPYAGSSVHFPLFVQCLIFHKYSAVQNYKTTCFQIKLNKMSDIFSDFT